MKHLKIFLIYLLIIFTFFLSSCSNFSNKGINLNTLIVHFIDVGEGDSILIQFNGNNMLIDAGPEDSTSKLISYLKSNSIKRLKYVIATHPHEDHIGGMSRVIKTFKIDNFYAPMVTSNTDCYYKMITALKNRNLKIHIAKPGLKLQLDKKLNILIIAPNNSHYDNLNNYSAVVKLNYKKRAFLFMGDAENISEDEILENDFNVSCDVLKVGHHGSKTSTSDNFLENCNPKIAVISCGKDNKYGEPNTDIIKKLKGAKCKIFRTDILGNIIVETNGEWIKTQ